MVVGWELSTFGIFFWFGELGLFCVVLFFVVFLLCFVRYKYTSSFQSMLMKCQDKNCFMGLTNIEGRTIVY